jgi:hypothetical protein
MAYGSNCRRAVEIPVVHSTNERLRPLVQLADPFIRTQARLAVACFDLPVLSDADTDQPGRATNPEALTLPSALHHPRVRGQGRHAQSLERAEDAHSAFSQHKRRSLERGGPSVTGGRERRRILPSPFARPARPPNVARRPRSRRALATPSVRSWFYSLLPPPRDSSRSITTRRRAPSSTSPTCPEV